MIDDGYTEIFGEFQIRRMLSKERQLFMSLISTRGFAEQHEAMEMLSRRVYRDRLPVAVNNMPQEIAEIVLSNPSEQSDLENLKSGMSLMLRNPLLAIRTCEICQKWWFDQDTGKIVNIGGQNLRRPDHAKPACRTDAGCERGTPENLKAFSLRNQRAFDHWMEWRAVGCPNPQDAIVRRNWMWFEILSTKHGLRSVRRKPVVTSGK